MGRVALILLIVAVLASRPAGAQSPSPSASPAALATGTLPEWTVLAYLDGEGSLEESTLANVVQMMRVGSSPRVNMVALVDRPAGPAGADELPAVPHWEGARLFKVETGRLETLEEWGSTNTADPRTLERFLRAAVGRFPARRYLLVIGDHGLAWAGVCVDQDGKDRLTLPELSEALEHCRKELDGRLAIVGMDACLMATVEVAGQLAPHTPLLVASEEAAPLDGWRYDRLLEELDAHPGIAADELARRIVDTYRDQFASSAEDSRLRAALGVTMSVVSLPRMAAVTQALDELAAAGLACVKEPDGFESLARARAACAAFGGSERTDAGYEMFDLRDLSEQLRSGPATGRPGMQRALERLDAAARAAVIHNMSGRARSDARGLAVFWPETSHDLEDEDSRYDDLTISRGGRWGAFLRAFGELRQARTASVKVSGVALSSKGASVKSPLTVSARLDAGQPDGAWVGLWEPRPAGDVLLATRPMDLTTGELSSQVFDGRWLHVTDGRGGWAADISDFEDLDGGEEEVVLNLPAQHCRSGESRWQDVVLHFYLDLSGDEPHGDLAYVSPLRPGSPDLLKLRPGDRLKPIWWAIEPDGKLKRREPAPGQHELVLRFPRALGLTMKALHAGRYGLGVVTRDTAGRWAGQHQPVRLGRP